MKRKIRKYRGGGMDAGAGSDFKSPDVNKSKNTNTNTNKGNGGSPKSKIGPVVKDVPFQKPFGTKSKIAATLVGLGPITTIGNIAAKQQYKSRQKFAKKEGLYKDFYKTTGNTLQPNSPIGKNYLKDAGFNKKTPTTPDRGGNNTTTIETTKPIDPLLIKPKENFFNFKAYNVGGLSGGVSYGPPPKKGPNSQVPPVKMKRGGKK
tara:strand:- start:60 stop:674 length:615 start_codon:yes stop_codon:yes gene_type:complete